MLVPGLVSVTFRKLAPARVVALAVQARLLGIEWGGDIHVPHGDMPAAKTARQLTLDSGLKVAAYGSYYRAGDLDSPPFDAVLASAIELGAPTIRVWAGCRASGWRIAGEGTGTTDDAYRATVAADLRRICTLAQAADIQIALEFHKGTLTDTHASTTQLMAEVAHPNLSTYWQPPEGLSTADCLTTLRALGPAISNIHVFQWTIAQGKTLAHPLSEGVLAWRSYVQEFAKPDKVRWALLEFVKNDEPDQFLADAMTLHELLP